MTERRSSYKPLISATRHNRSYTSNKNTTSSIQLRLLRDANKKLEAGQAFTSVYSNEPSFMEGYVPVCGSLREHPVMTQTRRD